MQIGDTMEGFDKKMWIAMPVSVEAGKKMWFRHKEQAQIPKKKLTPPDNIASTSGSSEAPISKKPVAAEEKPYTGEVEIIYMTKAELDNLKDFNERAKIKKKINAKMAILAENYVEQQNSPAEEVIDMTQKDVHAPAPEKVVKKPAAAPAPPPDKKILDMTEEEFKKSKLSRDEKIAINKKIKEGKAMFKQSS